MRWASRITSAILLTKESSDGNDTESTVDVTHDPFMSSKQNVLSRISADKALSTVCTSQFLSMNFGLF